MKLYVLLLVTTACQNGPKAEGTPVASVSTAAPAAPAASSAAPSKAWFEGAWQGTYEAELFRVELPAGNVKEWKLDDGKKASGAGKLSLAVSPDGTVTGTSTGALGDLAVSGRVEGDRAALSLVSGGEATFHGTVLATQTPEGMSGALSASSGDSLQVRHAKVALKKAAP